MKVCYIARRFNVEKRIHMYMFMFRSLETTRNLNRRSWSKHTLVRAKLKPRKSDSLAAKNHGCIFQQAQFVNKSRF